MEFTENIKSILLSLAKGNDECDIIFPNFRPIKAKIIGIDLINNWKSIKVKILEKNLSTTTHVFEPAPFTEDKENMVEKKVPYEEDWVNSEYIKNLR